MLKPVEDVYNQNEKDYTLFRYKLLFSLVNNKEIKN